MKEKIKLTFQIIIIILGFLNIAFLSYIFYVDEPFFLNEDYPIKINPDEWNPLGWFA